MVLADMSETVWLAVIGGIMLVVKQILDWAGIVFKLWMDRKVAKHLKEELISQQEEHLAKQDEKLETIVRQSNGVIEEVKAAARKEGHESGEKAALSKLGIPDKRN